jgi:hypothetical protein
MSQQEMVDGLGELQQIPRKARKNGGTLAGVATTNPSESICRRTTQRQLAFDDSRLMPVVSRFSHCAFCEW